MKALFFDEDLYFTDDCPIPEPKQGESLIRVTMAGICNTDVEITRGYMGFKGILGHEFVGIVEKTENPDLTGKRVVGEINCPCGICHLCKMGLGKHCSYRTVLGINGRNGVMAEYVTLPNENLHIVPDDVNDHRAVFVEPLAAAFEITHSVHIKPTQRVLLLGDGKLGLLCAQVVADTSCNLLVAGRHTDKLKILENRGIKTCHEEEFKETVPYDIVIECTGKPAGFELARKMVRPRGTIIQKSTYAENIDINISMLVVDEITLKGSRCGPFKPALNALKRNMVDVESLVSDVFPFDKAITAFKKAMERGVMKVLLTM